MAALTEYTSTEAVRACLGIDVSDCPDSVMVDSRLDLELEQDLNTWLTTHKALYDAGVAASAPAEDVTIKNNLLLYAQWFCAYEVSSRILLLPQISSDGKSQLNRFTVDLREAIRLADSRRIKYKKLLDEDVNGATSDVLSIMAASAPDFDPVTGVEA